MSKYKCYVAGGWFNPQQDKLLTAVEELVRSKDNIESFLPRKDGVKLSSNEFHDHKLRKEVFDQNIEHIISSDFVIACMDGEVLDTGTIWEVGEAMARGIAVYAIDPSNCLSDKIYSVCEGFEEIFSNITELDGFLEDLEFIISKRNKGFVKKVLFIGPDETDEQQANNRDIAALLLDNFGEGFRWVTLSHPNLYAKSSDLFEHVDLMIAVIDDRNPVVSWAMGQAHSLNVPIVSYTNYDYGINLMLAFSVVGHVKGKEELNNLIQSIKREGLGGIPSFDSSTIKIY